MPILIDAHRIQVFKSTGNNPLGVNRGLVKLSNQPNDGHDGWRYLSIGRQTLRLTHYWTGRSVTDDLSRNVPESLDILLDGCFLPLSEVAQMTNMGVRVTYQDVAHWTAVINHLRLHHPNPCQNGQQAELPVQATRPPTTTRPPATGNPPTTVNCKGSKYWIQRFVNEDALREKFYDAIFGSSSSLLASGASEIEWTSPLASENFAEYKDRDFLDRLGVNNVHNLSKLQEFWPNNGPHWDALGKIKIWGPDRTTQTGALLIEAKAHPKESVSSRGQNVSQKSKERIDVSFDNVAQQLNLRAQSFWTNGSYQFANRLAHLFFLREVLKHPAWLVYVLFANDCTNIPTSPRDLLAGFQRELTSFELSPDSKIIPYIVPVLIDVGSLGQQP